MSHYLSAFHDAATYVFANDVSQQAFQKVFNSLAGVLWLPVLVVIVILIFRHVFLLSSGASKRSAYFTTVLLPDFLIILTLTFFIVFGYAYVTVSL